MSPMKTPIEAFSVKNLMVNNIAMMAVHRRNIQALAKSSIWHRELVKSPQQEHMAWCVLQLCEMGGMMLNVSSYVQEVGSSFKQIFDLEEKEEEEDRHILFLKIFQLFFFGRKCNMAGSVCGLNEFFPLT